MSVTLCNLLQRYGFCGYIHINISRKINLIVSAWCRGGQHPKTQEPMNYCNKKVFSLYIKCALDVKPLRIQHFLTTVSSCKLFGKSLDASKIKDV